MARSPFNLLVLDTAGNVKAGATVEVRRRSDNALATVNSAETGAGVASNPLATDAAGRITNAWLERGAYNYTVSGSGIVTYSAPFDSAPGADSAVDAGWVGPGQIAAVKVAADVATQAELDASAAAESSARGTLANRVTTVETNQAGLRVRGGRVDLPERTFDSGTSTFLPRANFVIPHGLGRTPTSIVCHPGPADGGAAHVRINSWDATNAYCSDFNFVASATYFYWIAVG